jgi:hypothetical protein
MAQTIKLRRSAVQGAVPTTAQLALGELAINTYDGKLFLKKDVSGVQSIVEVGAGGGGGSPAGSSGQVQYNNAGAFGGASDVTIHDGDLVLADNATVTTPTAGVKITSLSIGGRSLVAFKNSTTSADAALQPTLAQNRVMLWSGVSGSNAPAVMGTVALTATGTATSAAIATTNRYTRTQRVEYLVTTASTSAVAGWRYPNLGWTVGGAAADEGGFFYVCRWGPATGVATTTNRAFVGMANTTAAPTDVQPSTITNIIGMGWDAADANIQIMHRGTAAITKVDLGASFPVPTTDRTKVYELVMFSPPGSTQSVSYAVTDLGTGATTSGTINTNMPTTTTLLTQRGWMSVGGTSSVIGIALMSCYLEADY